MARGGKREGAGRKPGSGKPKGDTAKTVARKAVSERLLAGDVTPLDIMIEAMLSAREQGDLREAAKIAALAAPYIHPRLSNINASQTVQGAFNLTVVSEFGSE